MCTTTSPQTWNQKIVRFGTARLDPDGCGCTDCIIGESTPLDEATNQQTAAAAAGLIGNATGHPMAITYRAETSTVHITDHPDITIHTADLQELAEQATNLQ